MKVDQVRVHYPKVFEEQYIEYCNATDVEFDVMLDVELS